MPFTGGTAPMPASMGGGVNLVALILEALNAARGTAYDTSEGSNVYVENLAHARAIASAWGTNQRLANQFDPKRMTSMLPRWERIMRIIPSPTATMPERRREIARRWARTGQKTTQASLEAELRDAIGNVFVAIEFDTVATATTWWPSGTPNPVAPWYSTISLARVHVEAIPNMTEAEFYETSRKAVPILDARLPAWATWELWRNDIVTGMPGFFLDHARNLDNSVFSV